MDDKFTSKNVASRPDVAFSRTFTRLSRSTANFWKRSISDNVTSLAAAGWGGSHGRFLRMIWGWCRDLFILMLWTFMEYIWRMIYIYIHVNIYMYMCIYIYGWWFQPLWRILVNWEGLSHILWKIKNVWNYQSNNIYYKQTNFQRKCLQYSSIFGRCWWSNGKIWMGLGLVYSQL